MKTQKENITIQSSVPDIDVVKDFYLPGTKDMFEKFCLENDIKNATHNSLLDMFSNNFDKYKCSIKCSSTDIPLSLALDCVLSRDLSLNPNVFKQCFLTSVYTHLLGQLIDAILLMGFMDKDYENLRFRAELDTNENRQYYIGLIKMNTINTMNEAYDLAKIISDEVEPYL
jgi:hypothetical protein